MIRKVVFLVLMVLLCTPAVIAAENLTFSGVPNPFALYLWAVL
jgi:hypothetical protein